MKTPHVTIKCPTTGDRFDIPCEDGKKPTKADLKAMGYDGFSVIAQHEDRPPPPELSDEDKERARVRAMDPADRYAELRAEIDKLAGRVAALEGESNA